MRLEQRQYKILKLPDKYGRLRDTKLSTSNKSNTGRSMDPLYAPVFFQYSNVILIQDAGYKSSTARFSSRPGEYKGSIDRKEVIVPFEAKLRWYLEFETCSNPSKCGYHCTHSLR